MRRRELILLGVAAAAWPGALRAQKTAMPVIGMLGTGSSRTWAPFGPAFFGGLSETGYVQGQNVAIERRWAEGHYDRLPALAAELVSRKVDVIVSTGGSPTALALKGATSTIPIVFRLSADLVESGFVASLARPGGNLTGVNLLTDELTPKRLELLSELVPQARVIALLVNPNNTSIKRTIAITEDFARAKGLQLPIVKATTAGEIEDAFASLLPLHAGALIVSADPFLSNQREQIAALASRHAGDLCVARVRRGRRAHQLWSEPPGCLSPDGHLHRKDPQGCQSGGHAGPATDHLRAGHQPQNRPDAGS
jgi:putative ABC transport system substrate-binding protein